MIQGIFNRTELLLGKEGLSNIQSKRVIIFGVGGVGSWCAESLVRTGIMHLTMVDADNVAESNINRQLMATTKTVGQSKVQALRERLLEINPEADITALQALYSEDTKESFHLEGYDYIIDCIDSLKDKISLLANATQTSARVYSSMGAALKLDPTKIQVAEFWKVRGCPLGAALRKRMKHAGIKLQQKVQCVYSEEVQENKGREMAPDSAMTFNKVQTNGSLAHITAIFGFTIAGLVIQDIVK